MDVVAVAEGFAVTSDQLADWTKRSAGTVARASSEFGAAGVDWTKKRPRAPLLKW